MEKLIASTIIGAAWLFLLLFPEHFLYLPYATRIAIMAGFTVLLGVLLVMK